MKKFMKKTLVLTLILIFVLVLTSCSSIGKKILDEVDEQVNNIKEVVEDQDINIDTPFMQLDGNGDGTREVKGDFEKLLVFKPKGDVDKHEDEVFISYVYSTKQDLDKTTEYFEELLKDTYSYYSLVTPAGAMYMGSINEKIVTVTIEKAENKLDIEISITDLSLSN